MQRVRGLLTDVGRVMLSLDIEAGVAELARRYGKTPDQVRPFLTASPAFHDFERGKMPTRAFVETCNRQFGRSVSVGDFTAALDRMLLGSIPEVLALWQRLRERGLVIASASNVNAAHHQRIVRTCPEIHASLHVSGASCLLGVRKGDPEFFPQLLNAVNRHTNGAGEIRPAELVFVDDIQDNLDEAARYGIPGVLFAYEGPTSVERLVEGLVTVGIPAEWLT